MILSEHTLDVLGNFSGISQGVMIKKNSKLRTISESGSVFVIAKIDEFPQDVAIYDLNELLGTLSLFEKPEIEFSSEWLTICKNNSKIRFYYADADLIPYQDDDIQMPDIEYELDVTAKDIKMIKKIASVMSLPDFIIRSKNGIIEYGLIDGENSTSNTYFVEAGKSEEDFELIFKEENLQLLPLDYKISISVETEDGRLSRFHNEEKEIEYFIALEDQE